MHMHLRCLWSSVFLMENSAWDKQRKRRKVLLWFQVSEVSVPALLALCLWACGKKEHPPGSTWQRTPLAVFWLGSKEGGGRPGANMASKARLQELPSSPGPNPKGASTFRQHHRPLAGGHWGTFQTQTELILSPSHTSVFLSLINCQSPSVDDLFSIFLQLLVYLLVCWDFFLFFLGSVSHFLFMSRKWSPRLLLSFFLSIGKSLREVGRAEACTGPWGCISTALWSC